MPSSAERRPARLERAPRRTRATAPAHSKSIMQRCGLLGLRFVHRTKTPTSRNAARTAGPRSTFPWAGRDPHPPRRWPSWLSEAEPSRFRGRVELRLAVDPARAGARPRAISRLRASTLLPAIGSGAISIACRRVIARTRSLSHRLSIGLTFKGNGPRTRATSHQKHLGGSTSRHGDHIERPARQKNSISPGPSRLEKSVSKSLFLTLPYPIKIREIGLYILQGRHLLGRLRRRYRLVLRRLETQHQGTSPAVLTPLKKACMQIAESKLPVR